MTRYESNQDFVSGDVQMDDGAGRAPGKRSLTDRMGRGGYERGLSIPNQPTPSPAIALGSMDDPMSLHLLPVQAKSDSAPAPLDGSGLATGGGGALDPGVTLAMGGHFGADFSNVRVHTDGGADAACAANNARALTSGTDIYFRAGAYEPSSAAGRELIGHELTHVVQQHQGQAAGLAAKSEAPGARSSLEADADHQGGAAAAAMSNAPIDWSTVSHADLEAEFKRREAAGETVPVAASPEKAKAHPLLAELARKATRGGTVPKSKGAATQAASDSNWWGFGSEYNYVEVSGVSGSKFIQHPNDSTANNSFAGNLKARTHGENSRRAGNFGVVHKGPAGEVEHHHDDFAKADWSLKTQTQIGGAGSHSLSMHNWAFSNIEASESYEVVDPIVSVKPGAFGSNVFGLDSRIPVSINGPASVKVAASQLTKQSVGWTSTASAQNSVTVTKNMSLGLSVGLGVKDAWSVGAEAGLSSQTVSTVWSQVQTAASKSATAGVGLDTVVTLPGSADGPKQWFVYPVFDVANFLVNAYPHNEKTGKITGAAKTFTATRLSLARLEQVPADGDGKLTPPASPNPIEKAEAERLAADKEGKVLESGGKKVKISLQREEPMRKDFDHQDYTQTPLTDGASREVKKTWSGELKNSWAITDSGGQKVSSSEGWSLGVSGGAGGPGKDAVGPSAGAKVGVSELTTTAAEFGDAIAVSGENVSAANVSFTTTVTGTKDPHKATQVILTPMFKERIYTYEGQDAAGTWVPVPVRGRSREYYPMPALTQQDVPRGTELKPEAAATLDPTATQGAAEEAKRLRAEAEAEPDPIKKQAKLDQLEGTLANNRPALEEVVMRAHPSLIAIDRAKNLYKIRVTVPAATGQAGSHVEEDFVGTLESLLDFTPRSTANHDAGGALGTGDSDNGTVKIDSELGLGGTGAQGRVHSAPGDMDLSETIKVTAPTADAAAEALAHAIQHTIETATVKRDDGKLGYVFLEMTVGAYPTGAKDEGKTIKWTPAEAKAGSKSFKGKDGKSHTLTLAQAIASPSSSRGANTFWRGPIDASGTYGEITKVIGYAAVGKGGEQFFSTPNVGQRYQEVANGDQSAQHDTERAKLLDALGPQIAKYMKEKMYVKALKRAYTVARMLNDVKALNDFAVLTRDDNGTLKTVSEHVSGFNDDIVAADGKAVEALSEADAHTKAENLSHRIHALAEGGAGPGEAMDRAIAMAKQKLRGNQHVHDYIAAHVVKPLEAHLNGDTQFANEVSAALTVNGYLGHK